MKRFGNVIVIAVAVAAGVAAVSLLVGAAMPASSHYIVESAILSGLAPGAVFPFIDSTPHGIAQAHIAVTDATSNCAPNAAAPTNIQVLVGEAGVALAPVLTPAANTGISVTAGQCVFHLTVRPGAGGVPAKVTDVVVRNAGAAALTGINTVTVSAEIR